MTDRLGLSALLSQALVAFTIEFDNEFEHQMPHWTTNAGKAGAPRGAPWLVSQVMWSNVMQFVGEDGVRVHELHARARTTKGSFAGLQRWGYVVVKPDPADRRPKPPRDDWVVRPTAAGRRAQAVWRPLAGVIEERWRARFGTDEIDTLKESLQALVSQLDVALPPYLPGVGYGLFAKAPPPDERAPAEREGGRAFRLDLSALLSQVLFAFTIEFERASTVSLAISANTLRVLSEEGVRVRDLPHLTGVSKEAISMSVGFLERRGHVVIEPDRTAARTRVVRLTPQGRKAQEAHRRLLGVIEERWQARFGPDNIRALRDALERLVGEPTAQPSPLVRGLEPYPEGWRASVRPPDTLPHHPTVLHRGGFPDGS